ncbi:MAG: hypothetical protein K2J36_04630 [Ruminococcus sp.]|nr:hypothetical protein [Ruminococcus sp.]
MIFSERYKDLVNALEGNQVVDKICGNDIDFNIRQNLVYLLSTFNEPKNIQLDRYDTTNTMQTDAFFQAVSKLIFKRNKMQVNNLRYAMELVSAQSLGNIFDVVELLYIELSDSEKEKYIKELNAFFDDSDLPWRMLDGKMIKIDAQQFECDLRAKALAAMNELKDAEPKFQSAYTELTTAIEAFEKDDYQSAINNAGKSYESVLKVILGVDNGNANELTQKYKDTLLCVPATMSHGGFESQVMKALPFIRNTSGADHGAGAKEVVISKPMAKLSINLAAALNTYLIEEYAASKGDTN